VEELGFESLFRSDHLTSLDGNAQRASLALWPSLAALALRTRRLRFGPLVCSMTFQAPALLAKMSAAVDQLSGGRFDLGIGAGWYAGEHNMFGIPFPAYKTRLAMLDEGARVIQSLWAGRPVSVQGKHYSLANAQSYPVPSQQPVPLIMGGKGEKTLRLVARYATEWNCSYSGLPVFRQKSQALDEACQAIGRDPAAIRRSVMVPFVIGRDSAAVQGRIDAHRSMFPNLPGELTSWTAAGFVGGSPAQVIDQLQAWAAAGCTRFMLQHNDLDDLDSLELLASDVLARVR
jgi:alkanesulfonate monooxygenase SsuD/methylene tetrahydromethanopterin reductase-like flavin-dependent oxidoreductase (luciferase family)